MSYDHGRPWTRYSMVWRLSHQSVPADERAATTLTPSTTLAVADVAAAAGSQPLRRSSHAGARRHTEGSNRSTRTDATGSTAFPLPDRSSTACGKPLGAPPADEAYHVAAGRTRRPAGRPTGPAKASTGPATLLRTHIQCSPPPSAVCGSRKSGPPARPLQPQKPTAADSRHVVHLRANVHDSGLA